MEAWWQRDQIISAFIVGSFSMTATLISIVMNGRRAEARPRARRPARRRLITRGRGIGLMFIAGFVAGGMGYRFGASALGMFGMTLAGPIEPPRATVAAADPRIAQPQGATSSHVAEAVEARLVEAVEARRPALRAASTPVRPASAALAPVALSDWLRSTGPRIYYRYAERLPDACDGATVARGNWVDGDVGEPVQCVDGAWLVFDVGGLVASGRLTRNAVYCFNLQSGAGDWARHATVPSPGLERVRIEARSDARGPAPLGFRVVRDGERDRIEFLNDEPRVVC